MSWNRFKSKYSRIILPNELHHLLQYSAVIWNIPCLQYKISSYYEIDYRQQQDKRSKNRKLQRSRSWNYANNYPRERYREKREIEWERDKPMLILVLTGEVISEPN